MNVNVDAGCQFNVCSVIRLGRAYITICYEGMDMIYERVMFPEDRAVRSITASQILHNVKDKLIHRT